MRGLYLLIACSANGPKSSLSSAASVDLDEVSLRGHTGLEMASETPLAASLEVVTTGVQVDEQPFEEEDPFGHGFDLDKGARCAPSLVDATPALPMEAHGERTRQIGAHPSHTLNKVAHVVWRTTCGKHAVVRLGAGLSGPCQGEATGPYPARIARLRARRHPLFGAPI